MADGSAALDLALNDIEEDCGTAIAGERVLRFQLATLKLIEKELPEIVTEAISAAQRYLAGQETRMGLRSLQLKCWSVLDEKYPGQTLSNPEVSAIRAAIFLLHAGQVDQDDDFVNASSFFLNLINNIEPHYEEELHLMKTILARCAPVRT